MFRIIAETAFSHEGDFTFLIKQIESAALAEAEFIKFQILLNLDDYLVKSNPSYDVIEKLIFSESQWKDAFDLALAKGLKIMVLPLDVNTLKFCLKHDEKISLYEIHSVCFKDIKLINEFKKVKKKIVLGIGGRDGKEIRMLITQLNIPENQIILMFGFQSFPTQKRDLNISKLKGLKKEFSSILGYADHSSYINDDFIDQKKIAYLLGATYLEKHIVVEKGVKRIDYETAVEFKDFLKLKSELNDLIVTLGNQDIEILNLKEEVYRNREKQMVYSKDLKKNQIISLSSIDFKITDLKSDFKYFIEVEKGSMKLLKDVKRDDLVTIKDYYEKC